MKEYLVSYKERNKIWIVLAKGAQDAIEQVWKKYIEPNNNILCEKYELHARSLGSLHNEKGKIIEIH